MVQAQRQPGLGSRVRVQIARGAAPLRLWIVKRNGAAMRRLQHMGTLQRPSTAMGVTLQSRSTKRKVRNMRKLLITTTALLALTGAAQAGWIAEMEQRAKTEQAQARARDVTAEIGIAGFTQCHHTAFWYTSIPAEATCWSESSNKSVKVYLMQGLPDSLDDGETLRVRATVRPAVTYRY